MTSTKLLILGGSGMLGHKLYESARKTDLETYVTLRHSLEGYAHVLLFDRCRTIEGVDATNMESVYRAFDQVRPSVVINCVGIVKQRMEAQDPLLNLKVNSVFPQEMKVLCHQRGIRFIHVSTDCVFSGKKGNYCEEDTADAEDLYGRTKYLGEVDGEECLTLRTSIIGRELDTHFGLVEWFLSQQGKTVQGFTRAIYSGLTTTALSSLIIALIQDFPRFSGCYHVASVPISKYQLLQKLRSAFALNIEIQPDEVFCCNRSLDGNKFCKCTGLVIPSWDIMITELAKESIRRTQWS